MGDNKRKSDECKRLWRECFGDSDEFINSFFNSFYSKENMLCIEQDGKLLSMLHIIPFDFNGYKIAYIYAVATDSNNRGKGYATKLIKEAIAKAKTKGFSAVITLPADEELRNFYSRFGFKGRYAVRFVTKEIFDFGTGDVKNDYITLLPFDEEITSLFNEKRMIIISKNR